MAPMILDKSQDDDFVRTISDDDTFSLEEEDNEQVPQPNKKRKRGEVNGFDASSNNRAKKRKPENHFRKASSLDLASEDGTRLADAEIWTTSGQDDGAMDSDFEFQIQDADKGVMEDFDGWGVSKRGNSDANQGNKKGVDIDELIARRRGNLEKEVDDVPNGKATANGSNDENEEIAGDGSGSEAEELLQDDDDGDEMLAEDAFGMGAVSDRDESTDGDADKSSDGEADSESDVIADEMPEPDNDDQVSSADETPIDATEQARREAFFAPEDNTPPSTNGKSSSSRSFQNFSLSRPILRGLASVGFSVPTPIQKKAIPVALMGKDVVGGAVTGSGKTAAFMIPIIERLLYRPKKVPTSRVAILMPTRELALQCFNVARKLASYTDITFCQLVGGLSLEQQKTVLRTRPDIIIATTGRFIDHMRNTPSFTVETLEILVLDEADRMLEDGFADELNEILTTIPKSRQTMLFSATMTDSVDKLIRVGLNRPVRLLVDAQKQTVGTLTQEFVRLRPGREGMRLGYLVHLCQKVFTDRVIVFFRQKKEAHRVRIIFGLLGIKAAELHGSMSQEQRIAAITSFTTHATTHLLATDLASRGLDIPSVTTVLNHSAPQSHSIYLHRVGRTARAGRLGRSCTLAAEEDRKVVKAAVRAGKAQGARIVSRVVDADVAEAAQKTVEGLEGEVEEILREEKEEKLMGEVEMKVRKGENVLAFGQEIKGRPRRTWFESEREKVLAKKKGMVELNGDVGLKAKGGGKLSGKDKKALDAKRERVEGRAWKKGKGDGGPKSDGGGGGKKGGKMGPGGKKGPRSVKGKRR